MVTAMKKLIAQVEALPEREQGELVELFLAEIEKRSRPSEQAEVRGSVKSAIDDVASRHFDALGKLA